MGGEHRGSWIGEEKQTKLIKTNKQKNSSCQLLNTLRTYSSPWQPVSLQASSVLNPVVSEERNLAALPEMISILGKLNWFWGDVDVKEGEVSERKGKAEVRNGRLPLGSISQKLSWESGEDVQCQLALTLKGPSEGQPSHSLPHSPQANLCSPAVYRETGQFFTAQSDMLFLWPQAERRDKVKVSRISMFTSPRSQLVIGESTTL